MAFLDIRTALLMVGLLYLILPTITWVVLAGQRSRQVALWCGGGLLAGGGMVLSGLQGFLPEWGSLSLGVLMILCSHFARIQSLRLDLGKPLPTSWVLAAIVILFLIFEGIHLGLQNALLRAQYNSCVGATLLGYIAILAWRIGRDEQSRSAKWIAWVYAVVACAWLFRAYSVQSSTVGVNVLTQGLSSQLLVLSVMLSSVIGHFGYVGLALDRSMRRELKAAAERARDEENRRLSEQIAHLDRQRSLGEMSASLGHELTQPLTAILTNAQVAKRGLQAGHFDSDQTTGFLDKIVHNTQRATLIIERVRDFIRPSTSRSVPVDLNRIAVEIAELLAHEADSSQVRFVFQADARKVLVMGDPIQLSQIVLNVFRNAIEVLSKVARREIQISCIAADGRAVLRIRDTGPALAPEMLSMIGKPFFTTKPKGLGMGVSISRSIAVQHGGTLSVANADGGGAVFELNLPSLPEVKL
ncbi:MAG: GHKL domain-containing protein [Azonexus sp.]|nr:GHKL domain-containing protein [Azonexus sp.]MBP6202167.1 GHKL domain-containing protein [Azonexus sp.]